MWRKLRVYFIGVGLGLVLTWALFLRNRNTRDLLKWTPNERVMAPLREPGSFDKPDNYTCLLQCKKISSLDIDWLLEHGKVDFGKSITREVPKVYLVEVTLEDKRELWATFSLTDSTSALQDFGISGLAEVCNCSK